MINMKLSDVLIQAIIRGHSFQATLTPTCRRAHAMLSGMFHERWTSAMRRRLRRMIMQAQGDAWVPAGCRGHGAGPASGINGEPGGSGRCLGRIDRRGQQELEERVYETLSSLSIGCMLAQRHAPRIFWSLSASAVFPRASYPDVRLKPTVATLSGNSNTPPRGAVKSTLATGSLCAVNIQ